MGRPRIAILASGQGTTAEAFIRASAEGRIDAVADLIICNNPQAGIFERCVRLNKEYDLSLETMHISHLTNPPENEELVRGEQTRAEESAILSKLEEGKFDAVVLMGYMKLMGRKLVNNYGWRREYTSPFEAKMLNTHPGLLPLTKGLYGIYAQAHALNSKQAHGGHTLHIVTEAYDAGPIIIEHKVLIEPKDTAESLFERVQQSEKKYLPGDIDEFIKKRQTYLKGGL